MSKTNLTSRPLCQSILRSSHLVSRVSFSRPKCLYPGRTSLPHRCSVSFVTSSLQQSGATEDAKSPGSSSTETSAANVQEVHDVQTGLNAPPTRRKPTPNELENKERHAHALRQLKKQHRLESETDPPREAPIPREAVKAILRTLVRVRPDLIPPARTTTFSTLRPEALRESDWVDLSGRYAYQFSHHDTGSKRIRTLVYSYKSRSPSIPSDEESMEVLRPFPDKTRGFFYLSFPTGSGSSPIVSELRFRLTDSQDPESWAYGKDLVGANGILPWSLSVLGMLCRPYFFQIIDLLVREKLLTLEEVHTARHRLKEISETKLPSLRPIIAGRPFLWGPDSQQTAAWVVDNHAMGAIDFGQVFHRMHMGRFVKGPVALFCLQPVGELSVDGRFILRCLQIVRPGKRVAPRDVEETPLDVANVRINRKRKKRSPWIIPGELVSIDDEPVVLTSRRL